MESPIGPEDEDRAREIYAHVLEARSTAQEATADLTALQDRVQLSLQENDRMHERYAAVGAELGNLTSRLQEREREKCAHVCGVSEATRHAHAATEVEHVRLRYCLEERKQYVQGLRRRNFALTKEFDLVTSPLHEALKDGCEKQASELGMLRAMNQEYDSLLHDYDANLLTISTLRATLAERGLERPSVPIQRRCDFEVRSKERAGREAGISIGTAQPNATRDVAIPSGQMRHFVGKAGDGLLKLTAQFGVTSVVIGEGGCVLRITGPMDATVAVVDYVNATAADNTRRAATREGIVTYTNNRSAHAAEGIAERLHRLLMGSGEGDGDPAAAASYTDDDLPPPPPPSLY